MTTYKLLPAARADLEGIWAYTQRHWGTVQAERYIRGIQATCEALASGTQISRSAEDIRPGYRKAAAGSHMLYFRTQSDCLEIVRILHQAMDVERNL